MEITVSVRELVSFIMRRGSVDRSVASFERLNTGSKLHRSYQMKQKPPYIAEVPLFATVNYNDITFNINGRADGIISDEAHAIIEEIKTTSKSVSSASPEDFPEYIAQADLYAYMYALEKGFNKITTRITFINTESGEASSHDTVYGFEELRVRVFKLLQMYYPFALLYAHGSERFITSAKKLKFPHHDYRMGQKDIILETFRTVRRGERLFVEAPTGLGKTLSVCYGAVKAVGEGGARKIFYLTPKSTVGEAPDAAFGLMEKHGLEMRKIKLVAKDKCCLCKDALETCSSDICPYSNGHYERANNALLTLLNNCFDITAQDIIKIAKEKMVCPHELMLDAALWCDVIICDCNYLFDPRVYLRRFFGDGCDGSSAVALIDEAHDLVDRAREMYCAHIYSENFKKISPFIPKSDFILYFPLTNLIDSFDALSKKCNENTGYFEDEKYGTLLSENAFTNLYESAKEFYTAAFKWLRINGEGALETYVGEKKSLTSLVRDCTFEAKRYCDSVKASDEKFLHLAERKGSRTKASVLCMDPSARIDERLSRVGASVMFSATLTPMDYFCDLLGGKNAGRLVLPSPFDRENLFCGVINSISTRYSDRERTVVAVAEIIERTARAKGGNYLVFLPSYDMLKRTVSVYTRLVPGRKIVAQKPDMTKSEREKFLSAFSENSEIVGFAVLGGMFSESIDLVGEKLIGTVIVGTGLAGLNMETNIISDYFARTKESGFEYAYLYPAMNKVLQAVGRVIRSEEDRGVCVLIDDRYATPQYSRLLCSAIKGVKLIQNGDTLSRALSEFWSK